MVEVVNSRTGRDIGRDGGLAVEEEILRRQLETAQQRSAIYEVNGEITPLALGRALHGNYRQVRVWSGDNFGVSRYRDNEGDYVDLFFTLVTDQLPRVNMIKLYSRTPEAFEIVVGGLEKLAKKKKLELRKV